MLSVDTVNEMLSYDKDTGEFYWKVSRGWRAKAGDLAGSKKSDGYIRIKIFGKSYAAHRLAYLIAYGSMPKYVDHIDRDKCNNRLENLRECTNSENQCNKPKCRNNTSGRKGVSWHKGVGKWQAQAKIQGKGTYLGLFDSLDAASRAYELFCKDNHGEFYPNNPAD